MHDPFPIPCPPLLADLTKPLADALDLPTLPLHIHEILFATLSYHLICVYVSPFLSSRLFPSIYPHLPPRTRLNWDVHVVSLVQSVSICSLALWVMRVDSERKTQQWEERVFGYTGAGGMIQGFAAGYFLWDLVICLRHVATFGWGLLAHAVAALIVFSLGFRPFVNFYGPTFILYELSSPFLNFHWFFDKLHMTGSKPQWYNGIFLLTSFFSCRLVWGSYQSLRVYADVWSALHIDNAGVLEKAWDVGDEVMKYATGANVPAWLGGVYLGSNVVLNTLNFYWFGKMIETIRKRFTEKKGKANGKAKEEDPVLVEGVALVDGVVDGVMLGANGELKERGHMEIDNEGKVLKLQKTQVRQRKAK